jgi:hypothetical protein
MWRNTPSPLAQTPGFGSVILDHFLFEKELYFFLGEELLNASPVFFFNWILILKKSLIVHKLIKGHIAFDFFTY